jgi:long-chain acyl-CoA synthetase
LPPTSRVYSIEPSALARALPSIDRLAAARRHPCIEVQPGDAAVLTYTSGKMGAPKGVVTTHANLLAQVREFRVVMRNDADDTCVSILPLSHLFELCAGFLGPLYGGGRICYVRSLLPEEILEAMREQRVSFMITVPLFLRLLCNGIRRELAKRPWAVRAIFGALFHVAALVPTAGRRVLFARIHQSFGGGLEHFVCGGAPLDLEVGRFFRRIGIPVYQGYGMAEASPVIATNAPGNDRQGSVGRPRADGAKRTVIAPHAGHPHQFRFAM